jgi:hypothetical protein
MNKQSRAQIIITNVLSLDPRWGRVGPPRNGRAKPSRIVTDSHVWHARISPADQKGPDGQIWDLFELFVYDEHRITAIFRDSDIDLRVYLPGEWERLFGIFGSPDRTDLRPD